MKADDGGRELFSCIQFEMDDWGNWRLRGVRNSFSIKPSVIKVCAEYEFDGRINMKRNPDAPRMPLHPLDTEKQTFGCRHTNPDICANNGIAGKCAFARKDNICLVPPSSWPKHFQLLKTKQSK